MVRFFIDMDHEDRLVPMRVPKRFLDDRFDHEEGALHGTQLFRIEVPTFEPITGPELAGIGVTLAEVQFGGDTVSISIGNFDFPYNRSQVESLLVEELVRTVW